MSSTIDPTYQITSSIRAAILGTQSFGPGRQQAMVITKLEEALLWLTQVPLSAR